jgi:hypothetical protein
VAFEGAVADVFAFHPGQGGQRGEHDPGRVALGYHQVTTAKLAAQAGTTWSRYAPGDHSPQ